MTIGLLLVCLWCAGIAVYLLWQFATDALAVEPAPWRLELEPVIETAPRAGRPAAPASGAAAFAPLRPAAP